MSEKEKNVVEAKAKKEKPAKKEKKKGRIKEAWRGFKSETKKIVWPNAKTVLKNTGIVLAVVLIIGAGIWLVDWGLSEGINAVLGINVGAEETTTEAAAETTTAAAQETEAATTTTAAATEAASDAE